MWPASKGGGKQQGQWQALNAEIQRITGNLVEEIRAQYAKLMARHQELTVSFASVEAIVKSSEARISELEARVKLLEGLAVSLNEILNRDSGSQAAPGKRT
jgi:hypothetical protein